MSRPFAIAAGGTGGHTFPAMALASELIGRGRSVVFVTDARGGAFTDKVPGSSVEIVSTSQIGGRNPLAYLRSGAIIARGVMQSRRLLARMKPAAVVGFGGFSTFPQMVAATSLRLTTAIHEQNAVLGLVNRLVAKRVDLIATSFPEVERLPPGAETAFVGNPVRPAILAARAPYAPPEPDGPFEIVVFGGSQGARVMADVVPPAVASLAQGLRRRLRIIQQAREEDVGRTAAAYAAAGVTAQVTPFIKDMPQRLAAAHLVIARSGASTYAELTAMGRPSILVPLPIATDDHQFRNALSLVAVGAAQMRRQPEFTPDFVAALLTRWSEAPHELDAMAAAAIGQGRPDAAARLADAVQALAAAKGTA